MKKIIAVPVVAVIAAVGAASAAGFAGGVSADPLQVGHDQRPRPAPSSARVIEWGYNDHLSHARTWSTRALQLNDADCVRVRPSTSLP